MNQTVNKQLLDALKGLIDLYENPASFSGKTGEQRMLMLESQAAKSHAAIHQARQAIAAAEQAQSSDAGWQCFNDGFKAGAEEMRDGLLQLCKDFSDRQNRPYMGDVLAQVDYLFDLIVSEIPKSLERKAEQAQQAEPVAAQCRFEGEEEWSPCTLAHHLLVQAHPKEWPHYETRALCAQPPAVAVPGFRDLTDDELWEIRNHVAINEVARDDDSKTMCVKHGRAIVRAMLAAAPQGAGDFKTWDAGAHEWWLSRVAKKGGAA